MTLRGNSGVAASGYRQSADEAEEKVMADTPKIPVDKMLEKVRRDEAAQSRDTQRSNKIAELDEEAARMRAARLRIARDQGGKG
jgi:hypothetical protein